MPFVDFGKSNIYGVFDPPICLQTPSNIIGKSKASQIGKSKKHTDCKLLVNKS